MRHGKYTKRKGYRKYKKYYTRKNGKRIQRQKRLQRQTRVQRQTRRKVGGADNLGPFNFVLPFDEGKGIEGQGWAYVTKLGSLFSQTKRPEQIIIFKKNGNNNYFIARCTFTQCDITDSRYKKNMEKKVLEVNIQGFKYSQNRQYDITTTSGDKYRIEPATNDEDNSGEHLISFFNEYFKFFNKYFKVAADAAAEANAPSSSSPSSGEKVKIKSNHV